LKLTIIGASGHGKVVADIAQKCGYDEIEFLDDDEARRHCGKWAVTGTTDKTGEIENDLFIAVGNAAVREKLTRLCRDKRMATLIHPSAVVAEDVQIGAGTVVMAGAVINPGARIGRGCIINTCSSIDHDDILEDYVHAAVGCHLAGTVHIGKATWIGAGAVVINNVSVCENCMIGAGAVVIRSIEVSGTYAGVPAERIR